MATSGVHIYINGKPTETTVEADTLKGSIRTNVPTRIGRRTDETIYTGKGHR